MATGADSTTQYYARRAAEYERIYAKPERQVELAKLRDSLAQFWADSTVLELACGTGYWTSVIAPACREVVAVDINQEVLDIAAAKPNLCDVQFVCADLYAQQSLPGPFDGALVAHWWSQVDVRETAAFFDALHASLTPGARVMLLDNCYVAASSAPITREDAYGNTFQLRQLDDGTSYEVLKNFPNAATFLEQLGTRGHDVSFCALQYYWLVSYTVS